MCGELHIQPHSLSSTGPASMSSDPPPPYPGGPSAPLMEQKNGQPGNGSTRTVAHMAKRYIYFFLFQKNLCEENQQEVRAQSETMMLMASSSGSVSLTVTTAPVQGQPLPPDYGPPPYEASQPGFLPPHVPGEGPMPMPMPMPQPPPGGAHCPLHIKNIV